jgi:outer membrane protein OmpA-like peptidoglycan-associated protein
MKLNDQLIQLAESKSKSYKIFDGHGLYIEISPNGSKFWRLKYRFEGKEKRISLGAYPEVSIEFAREHMRQCRQQIKGGIDPSQARKNSSQSITVPPKIASAKNESLIGDSPKLKTFVDRPTAILDAGSKESIQGTDKGAFSSELGAFLDSDDRYPQEPKKNTLEAEDELKTEIPLEIPSTDTSILQVLNQLRAELAELKQENRLIKDRLGSGAPLLNISNSSDNKMMVADREGYPQSQQELPQSQQELPQFTFNKSKRSLFTNAYKSFTDSIKRNFPLNRNNICQGLAFITQFINRVMNFVKSLLDELAGLGMWAAHIFKVLLSLRWAALTISKLLNNLRAYISIVIITARQLLRGASISIMSKTQSVKQFSSSVPILISKAFNIFCASTRRPIVFLLTLASALASTLRTVYKIFISFVFRNKKNMFYLIILSLLLVTIYLITQAFSNKEINQEITPIEGVKNPITVEDIKSSGKFYEPSDAELLLPPFKVDAPKVDAPKKTIKATTQTIYPYSKENNWKDKHNYVQVDYFTYFFKLNEYRPQLSDEAKKAFSAAAVNNVYLVVEGFSDARGDNQANLLAAKRRAYEFTNQLYVLGFNKEQIIGTYYDAPKISADCIEPMCSYFRKTHISVYVKKEFYDELKERGRLKQINQEELIKSQQVVPAPQKDDDTKVSTIDYSGSTNPMPSLIDGYRLTARLTYYFGLYESTPGLDVDMVNNLKELFNKPGQKFAIEGFANLSDDPTQDRQIAQGRALMMKDELIKLGLTEDKILGVFFNVPKDSKGCIEIGCAKGRKVVINLFNK